MTVTAIRPLDLEVEGFLVQTCTYVDVRIRRPSGETIAISAVALPCLARG